MSKWIAINNENDLKQVPQIFNTTPHADASDHYKLVHTLDVLEGAQKLGWNAVQASGVGNNPFGCHTVKLEHDDYILPTGDKVQMIINNSHDRSRKFSMDIGVYRLVCSNGLVIPIMEFTSVEKAHIGFKPVELLEELLITMDSIDQVAPKLKVMQGIDLTHSDQNKIALDALMSRLGEEELVKSVDLDKFLLPMRRADMSTDLWTTYNIVQEKIIGGHFNYMSVNSKGQLVDRKAREVNNFMEDIRMNKAIFDAASQFMPA